MILAGIAFVLRDGDQILLNAHTVVTYTIVPAEAGASTKLPDIIQEGWALSLRSCGLSTNAWVLLLPAESEWATNASAFTNGKALRLVATNRVAGKELYVSVERAAVNGFEYKLIRPK